MFKKKQIYNVGLFNKETELITPPKKLNAKSDKTIKVNSSNRYDAKGETRRI